MTGSCSLVLVSGNLHHKNKSRLAPLSREIENWPWISTLQKALGQKSFYNSKLQVSKTLVFDVFESRACLAFTIRFSATLGTMASRAVKSS